MKSTDRQGAGQLPATPPLEPLLVPRRGRPTAEQAAAISRSIIVAGIELFLAQGFERTSMEAVAARAGVPRSTLYNRFADKRALLREVIATKVVDWGEINSRRNWMLSEHLLDRLEHYAAWILGWAGSEEVSAFIRLANHAWPEPSEVEERLHVLGYNGMLDLIAADIDAFGRAEGLEIADPRQVALTLMAMLAGWLSLRSGDRPVSDGEARAAAKYLVGILFTGVDGW